MRRKVLVTGASGFTGSYLVRMLDDSGWEAVPLVRRSLGLCNEIVLDFYDLDFCHKIRLLPKVDTVVHLGAKIGWDGSTRKEMFKPNVLATAELAEWSESIGAYFLFASTAIVCGTKNPHITSETSPAPDTNYGYSKWLAEETIRMSGVKHGILRIAGIFGKNGPSHLGINVAIDGALNDVVPVQYGAGAVRRNYIYRKDLCSVIKFCIENEIEGTHLVSGTSINSISEMLQIICDVLLPGRKPECAENKDVVRDQIIEHSINLPQGRSFKEAIKDIKNAAETPV